MRGITVILLDRYPIGLDPFNKPQFAEIRIPVDNVLVAPLSDEEILDTLNLTGRRATYQLGIPKGDTHIWAGKEVIFWGRKWQVIGEPTEGIDELIPLSWNKKVKVESTDAKNLCQAQ